MPRLETGSSRSSHRGPPPADRLPDLHKHAGKLGALLLAARKLLEEAALEAAQTRLRERAGRQRRVVAVGAPSAEGAKVTRGAASAN